MVVCHCERVNDAAVQAAISAGAYTIGEVMAACRAGGDCGGCHPTIEDLIDERVTSVSLAVALDG